MSYYSDKVRVIVVGDSGVGKTSFVHLICRGEKVDNPGWTIGCSVEVKLHEYRAGTPGERPFFVELWDVGGWSAHSNSRALFYEPVHGVILVHDLTNRKSEQNLSAWISEVLSSREGRAQGQSFEYDPEQLAGTAGGAVPVLVVGTKQDLAAQRDTSNSRAQRAQIADECGSEQINLDCRNARQLAPGSTNAVRLSRFFDKVIERKFYSGGGGQQGAGVGGSGGARRVEDRRRGWGVGATPSSPLTSLGYPAGCQGLTGSYPGQAGGYQGEMTGVYQPIKAD